MAQAHSEGHGPQLKQPGPSGGTAEVLLYDTQNAQHLALDASALTDKAKLITLYSDSSRDPVVREVQPQGRVFPLQAADLIQDVATLELIFTDKRDGAKKVVAFPKPLLPR